MQPPAAVLALLMLLVMATEISRFGAHAALITGSVNLGEACYYDEECETITTFCRERRVCSCKERFREAEGRCVATVTARCGRDYDCSTLEYSQCVDNACVCREGYVRKSNDFSCLPVVTIYQGACEEDTQCQMSFGNMAICRDSMCECLDGHHFADGACWTSRGLGERCSNSTECSYAQDERHRVHCHNEECKCRDGYRTSDRVCVDGAAQISLSLALLLLVGIRFLILH